MKNFIWLIFVLLANIFAYASTPTDNTPKDRGKIIIQNPTPDKDRLKAPSLKIEDAYAMKILYQEQNLILLDKENFNSMSYNIEISTNEAIVTYYCTELEFSEGIYIGEYSQFTLVVTLDDGTEYIGNYNN